MIPSNLKVEPETEQLRERDALQTHRRREALNSRRESKVLADLEELTREVEECFSDRDSEPSKQKTVTEQFVEWTNDKSVQPVPSVAELNSRGYSPVPQIEDITGRYCSEKAVEGVPYFDSINGKSSSPVFHYQKPSGSTIPLDKETGRSLASHVLQYGMPESINIAESLKILGLSDGQIEDFKRQFTIQSPTSMNQKFPVKLLKVSHWAIVPIYATEGAACFDIFAAEDCELRPGTTAIIGTGWKMEIPVGTKLHLTTRSGMSTKGISVLNAPGTVDADYRGEVKIVLHNHNPERPYSIKKGDRIAQGEVKYYTQSEFTEVDELSSTDRGTGGLGSTGK